MTIVKGVAYNRLRFREKNGKHVMNFIMYLFEINQLVHAT
jgi:hypothetical protein